MVTALDLDNVNEPLKCILLSDSAREQTIILITSLYHVDWEVLVLILLKV